MSFVEVFEFRLNPGNVSEVPRITTKFREACEKIEGIKSVRFLWASDDQTVLWQMIEWRGTEPEKPAVAKLFALPEMGLFSLLIVSPPRRIRDFVSL